jgi:hypothetical protein
LVCQRTTEQEPPITPTTADIEAFAARYGLSTTADNLYALIVDACNLFFLHSPVPPDRSPLDGLHADLTDALAWRWGDQPKGGSPPAAPGG